MHLQTLFFIIVNGAGLIITILPSRCHYFNSKLNRFNWMTLKLLVTKIKIISSFVLFCGTSIWHFAKQYIYVESPILSFEN